MLGAFEYVISMWRNVSDCACSAGVGRWWDDRSVLICALVDRMHEILR